MSGAETGTGIGDRFSRGAYRFPLSSGQSRLWILDQLNPGSTAYNLRFAVRLDQVVRLGALQRSFDAVVERHEILRTAFRLVDGEPAQVVLDAMPVRLAAYDLRKLPRSRRERQAAHLATKLAEQPFELGHGPLLRAALIWIGPSDYALAIAMHHIVADAWAIGILTSELGALYERFVRDAGDGGLEPLELQYADYAVWQRQSLASERFDRQLAYWREELDGAEDLALPLDRPRPAVQTHRGAGFAFELPESVVTGITDIARAGGGTLFMGLLAAWAAVLGCWCDQDEVLVGVPMAGRGRPELERLIGFFVNTLVLRVDASADPTFRELVSRVRRVAVGAYEHSDVPFEKLVEALAPQRDLSRNPLFQVTFQLYESPTSPDAIVFRQQLEVPVTTSLFDLRVDVFRGPSGLLGRVEYDTALFDEQSIRWLIERFQFVCEQVVRNGDRRLSELDWVPPAQRELLEGFNATAVAVAPATVPELIASWAQRLPQRPAVADGDGTWTFRELHERAGHLAGALAAAGVKPGGVVGVCVPRGRVFVGAALAAMRLGAAYLPLDVAYPPARLAHVLADCRPGVVVTTAMLAERLGPQTAIVSVDDWPQGPSSRPVAPDPERLAYVMYTSGSTGTPKGVEIRHAGLMNLVGWHQRTYEIGPEDRGAQISSVGFDAAVWETWPQLCAGGALHVCDDETRGDVDSLIEWLCEERITISFIPTPLAELVLGRPWPRDGSLRYLLTGGDTLRHGANPSHSYALVNHYGPTESTVVATAGAVAVGDERPPIGAPIANTAAFVVDRRGCLVGPGQPGELYVGGPSLARGYRRDPELTREKFVDNPFASVPPRLYRTGDRVRWRGDGALAFLGRTDAQIKVRGHRIEPREIETLLASHPRIAQAVVAASPELTAYIVPRGTRPPAAAVEQWLRERLPPAMVPVAYAFVEEWPLTPNGKLDYEALPPAPRVDAVRGSRIAPADALEEALCGLWEETLGTTKIGVDDDFFELGGHSLLATQLVTRIRDAFGVALTLRTLFERRTPASLADVLRRDADAPHALGAAAEVLLRVLALSDEEVEAVLADTDGRRTGRGTAA